jgi:DNA-directed RNA polymerase specialized sigma24 family protein
MDRATALELLPPAYATALRLHEEGAGHAAIARELGVAVQAVPRLLEIGASKLDAILARDEAGISAESSGPVGCPPG